MSKRASDSREGRPRASRAARPVRKRPASEIARDGVLAGEAAEEIATNATPEDAVAEVVEAHVAAPEQEPGQAERDRHAEDVEAELPRATRLLQKFIQQYETVDRPFVRVVGRILYRLTVDGGRESCTVTPIAVALLLFLREHLDPAHRQDGTNRDTIHVTETNLDALLNDRLDRLTAHEWNMARQRLTGRGYQLTEDGRFVFRDWPEGIDFDPQNEGLWRKKRASIRGGGRASARHPRR
jgi:hypothetical protein